MSILLKVFQKSEDKRKLMNSFYEAGIVMITKWDKDTTKRERERQREFQNNIKIK